jgi:twinkle protein
MDHDEFFNFQTVLDAVGPRIDELVSHLLPNARKQAGNYRVGGIDGSPGSSLSISTKPCGAGLFNDHADPGVHGNAIGLWAMVKGESYQEAGRSLARFLGVAPEPRMHLPKRRNPPKITRNDTGLYIHCGGRTERCEGLNAKSINYGLSRGIEERTLRAAKCVSTPTHVVFPHFNEAGEAVLLKAWSCDGQKHMYSNDDPVPALFGKNLIDPLKTGGDLIITEGQWDALTWQQLGYPAVSIPSGAGNDEWIGEDWSFLNCFSQIYLDFDDDPTGQDAELKAKVRLGYDRCRSIRYRFKDANAALAAGSADVLHAAFKHAKEAPVERIVNAAEIKQKVRDRLNRTNMQAGTPFFLRSVEFEFRPYEITLWFGITSHGKSSVLSNQICYAASLGKKAMVASFEQATPMTVAGMLTQFTSDADIGCSSDFDEAFDTLTSHVMFFDSMLRANPEELIATMTIAHKQLGIDEFVIDNIMTLEVDRQDNTAQALVADRFRVFAAQYPVHIHLVAHPRKPPATEASKPPSIADIMGASEWSAMAHNIVCIWRDVAKSQRLAEMRDEQMDPIEILTFDESCPDGKAFWRKQRDSGELPMVSYFFNKRTKRAWKTQDDLAPYFYAEETPDEIITVEDEQSPSDAA